MVGRKRLDLFIPNDFLTEPGDRRDFIEAGFIQRAGLLLRGMRERANLSVPQLAERLNREPQEVDRIERGQLLESPPMSLMLQIAEICNEDISVTLRDQRRGAAL